MEVLKIHSLAEIYILQLFKGNSQSKFSILLIVPFLFLDRPQ